MRLWDFQTPVTHDLVERLLDKVCHVLSPRFGIAGRAVTRSDTA
jgi:hypothetical protein